MQRFFFCLGSLLVAASTAHATSYTFTIKNAQDPELQGLGVYRPYSETIQLNTAHLLQPSANNGSCADGSCFMYSSSSNMEDIYTFSRDGEISEAMAGQSPYETISLFTDDSYDTPLTLFTGSSLDPVVATGGYYAEIYFNDESFSPQGHIKIVDPPSASAVPEPSSLALLGSGALGLAATLRRRLL